MKNHGLLVDVHSHLDDKKFDSDLKEVLDRAKNAGICSIIVAGLNPKTNRRILELQEKYPYIIKSALGFYPTEIAGKVKNQKYEEYSLEEIDKEIAFIEKQKNKIIAISEIGLDFYWRKDNADEQIIVLKKFINLAEKIKKPIIVHTRDAESECIDILKGSKVPVVLHCFGGNKNLILKALKSGFYFSIPPTILRSSHFQSLVSIVPVNNLFLETDAPYLSPYKEKRNEPSFIIESVKVIAKIKRLDEKELINNLYMNYQKVFL